MINLYFANTPNVYKVQIALEELRLEYQRVNVNLAEGEQLLPGFLEISPNGRVPAIVDTAPAQGGEPITIFESGAILEYLAEKAKRLLPTDPRGKAEVMQWVMWQMAGQGPMLGQLGHFIHYAPEPMPYAIGRYAKECRRLYGVLDKRLRGREFIAAEYSIADIICWPWILFRNHHDLVLENYPDLTRWYNAIEARPAVKRVLAAATLPAPASVRDDRRARRVLFGQQD